MTDTSKRFEQDVWAFVKTLDPSAEVLFNHKTPDKITGSNRQVDVWINAKLKAHIPISILVSCKNYKRKLNITNIESFIAEVRSTGASTGIIYSSSGFTGTALKKAHSEGLSCCRLFRNEPADIPQSLVIWSYFCMSNLSLHVTKPNTEILNKNGLFHWSDLFNEPVSNSNQNFLEYCISQFNEIGASQIKERHSNAIFPKDWAKEYLFTPKDNSSAECKVVAVGHWKKYKGKIEAHLLNGSYCFSSNTFQGNMYSPVIDTKKPPGPWWEEISDEPTIVPNSRAVFIFHGNHFDKSTIEELGQKLIDSNI